MKDSIIVFSKTDCKNCMALKNLLKKENIEYKDVDIFTPEALTELSMNEVYTRSAPVLQIGNNFYTTDEICLGPDQLNRDKVIELLGLSN